MSRKPLVTDPLDTWFDYMDSTWSLVSGTRLGLLLLKQAPALYRALDWSNEDIQAAESKANSVLDEIEGGFPTLHAHALLGVCGAFESFVEDTVVGLLVNAPELLERTSFERVKIPVSILGLDPLIRNRRIVQEASRATNADLSAGVTRYERLLALVGLDGPVPERVRTTIFQAIEIRNVWAHRGGIADSRFIEKCGASLGLELDQRINIDCQQFDDLFNGFGMYGAVIANRHLDVLGTGRMHIEPPGYEGVLDEVPKPTDGNPADKILATAIRSAWQYEDDDNGAPEPEDCAGSDDDPADS